MSIVAMKSQCMKTIIIHLIDKSDFILSDHKTLCKSFIVILVELANSVDCNFSCTKLALQKIQSVVNTNQAKRLAPYFARWCAATCRVNLSPELLRVFKIFSNFEKQRRVTRGVTGLQELL